MMSTPVVYSQSYILDIYTENEDGSTQVRVANATHSGDIMCAPGESVCRGFLMFYEASINYAVFNVKVRIPDALSWWRAQGLILSPKFTSYYGMGYIRGSYTRFEMGWKYFFVTASIIIWAVYTYVLFFGPNSKAAGRRLNNSIEQNFAWLLSFLLIWFNDPTFAAQISMPAFGTYAFYALSVVTFLTALLLYWALHFHIATLQSEAGLRWQLDISQARLPICSFWMPKVIWCVLFWVVMLSSYLWSRYQQVSDPAYSLLEEANPIGRYFTAFVAVLGALYILYVVIYFIMGCRQCRRMRTANRFFNGFTACTFLVLIIGLFVGAFSPAWGTSGAFLTGYGAANIYVWCLCIAFFPDEPLSPAEISEKERASGITSNTGGVMGAGAGRDDNVVTLSDLEGAAGPGEDAYAAYDQAYTEGGDEDDAATQGGARGPAHVPRGGRRAMGRPQFGSNDSSQGAGPGFAINDDGEDDGGIAHVVGPEEVRVPSNIKVTRQSGAGNPF